MRRGKSPSRLRLEALIQEAKQWPCQCQIWSGAVLSNGYGQAHQHGKHVGVHRLAWELAHKKRIPAGMTVDHICGHRACVNPKHLRLRTIADNVRAGIESRKAGQVRPQYPGANHCFRRRYQSPAYRAWHRQYERQRRAKLRA